MDDLKTIKYFDIVVREIKDILSFSINNILIDGDFLKTETKDQKDIFFDIVEIVKSFGITYKYIEPIGDNGWYKLTEYGIKLKDKGCGHIKFQKLLTKTPMTKYEKTFLIFFIIFGLFEIFQTYQILQPNISIEEFNELKSDFNNYKIQNDLLIKSILEERLNDTIHNKNLTKTNNNIE